MTTQQEPISTHSKNTSWADASEDSDVDKDGFKYVTEYITRDNKKYKVTKKIKVAKKVTKINKKVQERKKWKPFGLALNQEDLQNITTISEPIFFEKIGETALQTVQNKEAQLLDKLQSQLLSGTFTASSLSSASSPSGELSPMGGGGSRAYRPPSAMGGGGPDSGDNFFKAGPGAYRPPGSQQAQAMGGGPSSSSSQQGRGVGGDLDFGGKGKYVPPSQRGASGGAGGASGGGNADEKRAILINNLGPDVTEEDLRMLFGKCGFIERCSLLTDRRTGASKGLAFITFSDSKAAENAIARYDGKGLDHMIIGVEYAKPHKTF